MTTVVSIAQGGTGANSAADARDKLGAASNTGGTFTGNVVISQDLSVTGNLYVSGNTVALNAETLLVEDADIVLLSNVASSPSLNAGLIVNRGSSTNTFLRWNEATDKWGWSDDGATMYNFNTSLDSYAQANSAYSAANNRVLKAGDTMTGELKLQGSGISLNVTNLSYFAGNVGIGTTSPGAKVQIDGNSDTSDEDCMLRIVDRDTASGSQIPAIQFLGGASANQTGLLRVNDQLGFQFRNNANSTIATFNQDGNLGIGTTSPAGILHLEKSAGGNVELHMREFVSATSYGASIDAWNGSGGNLRIRLHDSGGTLQERFRITSAGNVGIGTTSPARQLTLSNSGAALFSLLSTGDDNCQVLFGDSASDTIGKVIYRHSDDRLTLQAGNIETVHVVGGNVGIGTSSPTQKLHIGSGQSNYIRIHNASSGDVSSGITITRGDSLGFQIYDNPQDNTSTLNAEGGINFRTNGASRLFLDSSGNLMVGGTTAGNAGTVTINVGNAGSTAGGLQVWAGTAQTSYVQFGDESGTAANHYRGYMAYAHGNDSLQFGTASTERLRIDSSGKVGVGTTSNELAKFQINEGGITAAAISTGWPAYNAETATQSKYLLDLQAGGNGSVSTGGQGPSVTLIMGGYYDARGIITMRGAGGASPSDQGQGYGKDLMVKAGNSDNGNGLVGGRLYLAGGSGYSGGAFGTNYGAVVLQPQGGSVGISTNPNTFYKLDVNGSIQANGTMNLSGDGGQGYVASRVILRTHNNYRGTGIYMTGETSAVSNNTFYIGTPYTDHSAGVYIRYTANNYQTDYQSSAYTAAGLTLMHLAPSGAVSIPGSLSKGSGSFKIDHPLPEKANSHYLVHSFIEGPQADLIYRGRANLVNGIVTVNIDTAAGMTEGTFVLLCRDVQCFTSNETDWDNVRGYVDGNILTIECQNPVSNSVISWMVIGERQDKHMYDTEWTDENGKVIVEPEKPAIVTLEEPNVT